MLFSMTLRDVALRAIGVTAYGVLRQSRSFRAATTLGDNGRHRSVRWCVNKLFSMTLRDVALRAIGVTGASALRLMEHDAWR